MKTTGGKIKEVKANIKSVSEIGQDLLSKQNHLLPNDSSDVSHSLHGLRMVS